MTAVKTAPRLVPDTPLQTVLSSCGCVAGRSGYHSAAAAVWRSPNCRCFRAVREVAPDTVVVTDGTWFRHQTRDEPGLPTP